jgi:hypothetical protein
MGLILNVFRSVDGYDCSNNGISSNHKELCVSNVDGPFEPNEECPEVILEVGPFNSVRLVPASLKGSGLAFMFGGNYAGTSDSRFADAVEKLCGYSHNMIKIHDRVEY